VGAPSAGAVVLVRANRREASPSRRDPSDPEPRNRAAALDMHQWPDYAARERSQGASGFARRAKPPVAPLDSRHRHRRAACLRTTGFSMGVV
jgi:hypothetical protein